MPRPRTVAIIQARMGSARFPRKVLADLAGRPVIWHLLHRISQCTQVDEVVVATSDQPTDDDLAAYVTSRNFRVVRGSENNVLQRLLKAATESQAEIIVRVTGDAPLVDPTSLDAQITGLMAATADFCIAEQNVPNINEGFEAFTMAALTKLSQEAADDPIAIEHTCTYFKLHPSFVKIAYLPVPQELQFQGARVSVDTPRDLEFLIQLHGRLNVAPGELDLKQVVQLLHREPELTHINSTVTQKAANAASCTAVIRCDASPSIGLGHLVRCLALAEVLRDEQSFGITFITHPSEVATQMIAEQRHRHTLLKAGCDDWEQVEQYLLKTKADVLILDVRDGINRDTIKNLRQKTKSLLVDIDDAEEKRLECDWVFFPPVPQVEKLAWSTLHGELKSGWNWVLLRLQFQQAHRNQIQSKRTTSLIPRLLVTMGGSDPAGMTLKAVRALREVKAPFHAIFVLGASFCHETAFWKELNNVSFPHEIQRSVHAMADLMSSCDLALACFSITAYELAATGVPAIYLSLTDDHLQSSLTFVQEGIGISLGHHERVTDLAITKTVEEILIDTPLRVTMSQRALVCCDGLGARRISQVISESLKKRP